MSEIPTTPKAFERWLVEQKSTMPTELYGLGYRALLTLKMIEMNPPATINAIQENVPKVWAEWAAHLMAFAEAYGAWKAKGSA